MTTTISKNLINDEFVLNSGDSTMTGTLIVNKTGAGVEVKTTSDTNTFTGYVIDWVDGTNALTLTKNFSSDTASISNTDNAGSSLGGLIFDSTGDIRTLKSVPPMANDLSMVHKKYVVDNFVELSGDTITGTLNVTQSNGTLALDVLASEVLGGTLNDVVILDSVQGRASNSFKLTNWLRRDATGSDWNTAVWHSAISVDTSFATPGVDTRCWEERDPNVNSIKFGSGATAYLTLATAGASFSGQILADIGTISLPGITFSGDNNTGIYQPSTNANEMRFACGGSNNFAIESNGTLNVLGTANYELLVTHDDDLPNKKYVDTLNFAISVDSPATFSSTAGSANHPVGISRFYESNAASPDGDWAHALTIKDSTTRGFQFGVLDTTNSIYFRNQASDGAAWEAWTQLADRSYVDAATVGSSNALESATTTVNVSSATAPISGEVLTATSSTTATWQIPGAGSFVDLTTDQAIAGIKTFSATSLNLSGGSAALTFDEQTAPDGLGISRITRNDGGGNWNFRAGHYFSGGIKSTKAGDGGASIIMNTDAVAGAINISTASAVSVSSGDTLTLRNNIAITYDSVTFSSSMTNLQWAKDPDGDNDLTRKSYVDGKMVLLPSPETLVSSFTATSWTTVNSTTLNNAGAKKAILRCVGDISKTTTTLFLDIYIRETGSGLSNTGAQLAVSNRNYSSSSISLDLRVAGDITVTLDASQDFDYYLFQTTALTSDNSAIYLIGYYV